MKSKYDKIQQIISNMKQPDYRYLQITNAIFRVRTGEFKSMSILPVKLRNALIDELGNSICCISPALQKKSDQVGKILFSIPGGERIETVRLSYKRGWESPFNEQRSKLMPVNDLFPLQEVMKALDNHIRRTGRKVYIAYIMLQGINDSAAHAEAVAGLLRGRGEWEHLYQVDLIPFNPTGKTPPGYRQTDRTKINRFKNILRSKGINVTIRMQFGSEIGAGCGQLYGWQGD
ncbi:hypothetical protein [Ruminiclostridium cellobioparum]|uniref:hypothetical protein n=1 Tax=Ruminiclostridium cellobioparum TaxID=29355 RepID=UPI0028A6C606|nr:hypothetical protein [Ruminiclostridium cellobioparum]